MSTNESDNARRWDGESRGRYEVWFLTMNHTDSGAGFWIRYTLKAPIHGPAHAEVWFAFFDPAAPDSNFGVHERYPIDAAHHCPAPFALRIGDSRLTHTTARGAVASADHRATWDLSWLPALRTHRLLPSILYKRGGGLADTTVLSPHLDAPMTGTITVDGREFTLRRDPGSQSHLWGKKHAHSWGWGRCTAFGTRHGVALEVLTARLEKLGRVLPPITVLTLYMDGEFYIFNQLRHTPLNRATLATGELSFQAHGPRSRIEGTFRCRPQDLITAPYTDPDGTPLYCANTCVGDLELFVYRRPWTQWIDRAHLVADGTAQFEIADRAPDPAVATEHQLVQARNR